MANKRITDVDFLDSLNSDESFFVNRNNSIKQINKKNVVMEIVNGGTGATTAEQALINLGAASQTAVNNAQTTANEAAENAAKAQVTADDALAKVDSLTSDIIAIKYVSALPDNPDSSTLYLIPKE